MVNVIWGILIVVGILFGLLTGKIETINAEVLSSAKVAFDLLLEILPILVLWMGLMRIAENSGLLQKIADLFTPVLRRILPSVPKGNKALGYIASNIVVNMVGLGSAATPFGLKAMEELQKIKPKKDEASEAMMTFIILNTAGVTIIPTTIISLRMAHGSVAPAEILVSCLIATSCAAVAAILMDYFIRRSKRR